MLIVSKLLANYGRRRIRRMMLGYRYLKAANKLANLKIMNQALTKTKLELSGKSFSSFILGAGKADGEAIARQYLLRLIAALNLNCALLNTIGKRGLDTPLVYYMPARWRVVLRQHGFKVAEFRSRMAWCGFVLLLFMRGLCSIGRCVFDSLKYTKKKPSLGRHIFFVNLTSGNLPQPAEFGCSHDVVTWYSLWSGGIKEIDAYSHTVKNVKPTALNNIPVISTVSIIPVLPKKLLIPFLAWGLGAAFLVILDLLRGRWWHALLFNEAIKAKLIRLHGKSKLAQEYLFNEPIYRPLWTYDAQKLGSKITFYFYATWEESFRCFDRYKHIPLVSDLVGTNWPNYLVWDNYQSDFVQKAGGQTSNITLVGPIWSVASSRQMPVLPRKTIAVFDVSAMREAVFRTMPVELSYYIPEIVNQFLSDIHNALVACNGYLALKRKREIGNQIHPKYAAYLEDLSTGTNFITVDPSVSPFVLIEASAAVISIPFTSTAVIAKELGKPSIYYDPTGLIQLDDLGAHGVPIINSVSKLRAWIYSSLAQSKSVSTSVTLES